ncbi:MAG TPA: LuxR C-terminal-related transcriptional regulator [Burkholderiaceae bacterium]|nr:LuxR C-terminal-related transcriptional regulator [Burkholderiaceae bacterium]
MYRATDREMQQLLGIIEKLGRGTDSRPLRQSIADDLLKLVQADMLASFVWNDALQQFEDVAFVNMTPANLDHYQAYFQYCDPITSQLQLRRSATLVSEVMAQLELEKTEFYNDFLRVDGLKWGINLYAYDGSLNIGDLRIWRGAQRPPFGEREVALLDLLKPHFTNSLINARSISDLRGKVSGWHDLWEHHPNACFVFGRDPKLAHQNEVARNFFRALAPHSQRLLLDQMLRHVAGQPDTEIWGDFRLSVATGGETPGSYWMVQLNPLPRLVIDRQWVLRRFALTAREADVCLWIMRGLSDQVIAERACLSVWTIRTHIKSIFAKLDVSCRSELTHVVTSSIAEIHVGRGAP